MNLAVNQNLRQHVDRMLEAISWGLLPPRCLLCHQAGMPRCDLCQLCFEALPLNRHACQRCAEPLAVTAALCVNCQKHPPPFHQVLAPFTYHYPFNVLIPRFKFHQDLAAGRVMAEVFAGAISGKALPDALVPVPLHLSRLRQRGFDQALVLAKTLSTQLHIPVHAKGLKRVRFTEAQSDLDAKARQLNCCDAFVALAASMPAHVALVDDVMTTGATVRECSKVLLNAGVKRVDVWVMARVALP
jgi:ComF family protein